jgi:LPXTG-motif cell wall-anchored protein
MFTKGSKLAMAALAFAAVAALAFGQTSDKTTTVGKYRIALVSPNEGASVPSDQVRVVLTPNTNAMGDEKTQVDVFLDGQQKGVIKSTETDFRVDGVKPGPHKLVLIARNPVTDQQFDRREINFVATGDGTAVTKSTHDVADSAVGAHVPPAVNSAERKQSYTANDGSPSTQVAESGAASSTASSSASTSSSNVPSSSSNMPSSNPPGSSTYNAPPPSSSSSTSSAYENKTYSNAPSSPSASYSAPQSSTSTSSMNRNTTSGGANDRNELPKTASNDALLALAGAALLATGLVLRRNG